MVCIWVMLFGCVFSVCVVVSSGISMWCSIVLCFFGSLYLVKMLVVVCLIRLI